MLLAPRYSQGYSLRYLLLTKLIETLLACEGRRYLQQYSQLARLLVTPNAVHNATHDSRIYSLLPAGYSQRHSLLNIYDSQRQSPLATRDPQRSLPLATSLESYPNPW